MTICADLVRQTPTIAALVAGVILCLCSQSTTAQAIGDTVWQDLDADGVHAGPEPGLPGVEVRLFNCNNAQIASTTTSANGWYQFDGLPAGNYRLRFIAPVGYRLESTRTSR
jgi:hypothetical protein